MADYIYSAFISYRHIEPDQTIARRIEHSIELFSIPSVYRKDPKQKHFSNVFRDSDELSLDRDLTTGIDLALSQSEFLIVILSPQYKESPWCLHEIEEFLKTHDRSRIMCVIANGEPKDILPDILTHIPADDGSGETIYKEPLCADFRLDPTTADRLELPRLLSTMLGCSYDDLMKRREIYRRKQFAKIATAVLAVLLTIIFLQIRNLASLNSALRDTLYSQSQTLAAQSMQHLDSFDRYSALSEAIQALPDSDSSNHPVTPEATYALAKATYAYQPSAFAQVRRSSMQYDVVRCAITPKKRRIVTMDTNGWILVQTYKGERISNWEIDGTSLTSCGFIVPDEYTVLAWRGGNLYSYDYEHWIRNWGIKIAADEYDYMTSGIYSALLVDQTSCSVITRNCTEIINLSDGKVLNKLFNSQILEYLGKDGELSTTRQFVTEDRKVILAASFREETSEFPDPSDSSESLQLCITVWDPETGEFRAYTYDQPSYCTTLYATPDGKLVAVSADGYFDAAEIDNFNTDTDFTVFRTMTILCFDMADGSYLWDYDTEMPQSVTTPQIHYIPSKTSSDSSLISVTFEVDNYTFNLTSGELYSSVTLPDSILLIDRMRREFSSFYCCNHKYYTVNNMTGKITEYNGFAPFPEKVQSASWISGTLLAFNGKDIYWFESISDEESLGSVTLPWAPDILQTSDCGVNEMALLLNSKLTIVNLDKCEIVLESDLDRWFGDESSVVWKIAGTYFDGSGVVVTGLDFQSGVIHVAAYNSKVKKTRLLYSFPPSSDDVMNLDTDTNWTDSLVYSEGTVYFVPEKRKNTILYYNIVKGKKGHMDVTGLPESMILAGVFKDFISDPLITIPSIAVSPDGEYMFSTVCDLTDYTMRIAVVSLETGKANLIESCGTLEARSRHAAFSEDNSLLALSTDYSILLFSDGYEKMTTIPVPGLGVSSMTWFNNELYVAFTSHLIHHYSANGELLAEIELEHESTQTFFAVTDEWIPVKGGSETEDALIYVEDCNMNLIRPDSSSTTPLLHIPGFVGWSNENDRFVTASFDTVSLDRTEKETFTIYVYPHYTYQDLIEKGKKQLAEME